MNLQFQSPLQEFPQPEIFYHPARNEISECGDSSPLLLAATWRGNSPPRCGAVHHRPLTSQR